jgi:hypothetical protein
MGRNLQDLTCVLPACEQSAAVKLIESYFGTRLRPGESSYYNSSVWRWFPSWVTPKWKFWGRTVAPLPGVVEIRLHDNVDGLDGGPMLEGHPPECWVVKVTTDESYPIDELRKFLSAHGTLVEQ